MKKLSASVVVLTTALWLSGAVYVLPVASASTVEELQAQINSLLQQIAALQVQLQSSQGVAPSSSLAGVAALSSDLTVGSKGDDVKALQAYLVEGGFLKIDAPTSYFGSLTKAALAKWQSDNSVSPAAGYFGPKTRAKFSALAAAAPSVPSTPGTPSTPSTPSTPVVGVANELKVSLAADNPSSMLVPKGAAGVPFLKVKLEAGSTDISVKSVNVERIGVGADSAFAGVLLLDENGVRMDVSRTFSSDHKVALRTPFTVKAGESKMISVAGDMASDLSLRVGEQPALKVYGVEVESGNVVGLPVSGNQMVLNNSLTIGSVTLTRGPLDPGTTATKEIGTAGYVFSSLKLTSGSAEDMSLKSFRWYQAGSVGVSDLSNVKVYVDGVAYDPAVSSDGKYYTAVFGDGLKIEKGLSKEVYIKGDVAGGSGRSVDFDLYRYTDVQIKGLTYGYNATPSATAGCGSAPCFQVANPNYNAAAVTVSNGSVAASKATTVVAQNVAKQLSGQPLGGFVSDVKGETVSVGGMVFNVYITGSGGQVEDITNVAVYDDAGAVVAGPVDGSGAAAYGTLTFSDTVTFPIGLKTYTLKGKLGSDFTNNQTIAASTTASSWTTVRGGTTGNTVIPTPSSAITFNAMTVKAAALAISVSPTPAAQNIVRGVQGYIFAKYIFDGTNSGEDIRITTFQASSSFPGTYTSGELSGCAFFDGSAQLNTGSNVVAPTAQSATQSFTFDNNLNITKGTAKTLDFKCNVAANGTATSYAFGVNGSATISATGLTSGGTVSPSLTAAVGQVMTAQSGALLTVTSDSSSPVYRAAVGGAAGQILNVLRLTSSYEALSLTQLALQLSGTSSNSPADIGNSVKIYDGSTLVGEAVFVGDYGTATISNVTVPKDSYKLLTLKSDLAYIGTSYAGSSGAFVKVDYDGDNASDTKGLGASSGSTVTSGSTSDTAVAGLRMFKSAPTITQSASGSSLTNGSVDLLKVTVSADAKGDIQLYRLTLGLATTGVTVTSPLLAGPNGSVDSDDTNNLNSAGNVVTVTFSSTSNTTDRIVSAGSSKTFTLRGTVAGAGTANETEYATTNVKADTAFASIADKMAQVGSLGSELIVWSPMSTSTSGTVAVTDLDWANGYGLSGCFAGLGQDCSSVSVR